MPLGAMNENLGGQAAAHGMMLPTSLRVTWSTRGPVRHLALSPQSSTSRILEVDADRSLAQVTGSLFYMSSINAGALSPTPLLTY